MTPAAFRKLALALPGAIESAHCGHPDFRIHNKVFASHGAPDGDWAMVRLSPELQPTFVTAAAETFRPASGAWGCSGCTMVICRPHSATWCRGRWEWRSSTRRPQHDSWNCSK